MQPGRRRHWLHDALLPDWATGYKTPEARKRSALVRGTVVGVLWAVCLFMTFHFHLILQTETIFSHLYYIPIILAAIYWGRRGLPVALISSVFLLASHASDYADPPWADVVRASMFVVVFLVVAWFSERIRQATRAVAEGQQNFETVFEAAMDGILLTDVETRRFTMANQAFSQMTGYSIEELQEMDVAALRPEEELDYGELDYGMEQFQKAAAGLTTAIPQLPIRRKGGGVFYADVSTGLIVMDERPCLLGIFRDVTERMQVEAERERLLHDLQERVNELACTYNVAEAINKGESVAEALQKAARLLPPGWQHPEITRAKIVFDGAEYASEPFAETQWKQSSEIVANDQARGVVEVYYLEQCPELDEGPFLAQERELIDYVATRVGHMVELKEAEQQLREREADQRALISSLPYKVFRKDQDAVYVFCNEGFAADRGIRPDEIPGKTDYDFFPRELADKYRADDKRLMTAGQAETIEERYVADGQETFVQTLKTPVIDEDGNVIGILGIFWDITERKEAEKRIAHLNQVLRAIRDVNQLIASERDRDRLLQGACDALTSTRGYHSAWIALLDRDDSFVLGFESGLGDSFTSSCRDLQRDEMPRCMRGVLGKSEVITIEDRPTSCGDCPLAEVYPEAAAMAVRLEHAGEVYGLVTVSLPVEMSANEEEQSLFAELSSDLAFGLSAMALEADRKQAEQALQESEDRFRTLFESTRDAFMTLAPPEWKFTSCNPATLQMFGAKTEDEFVRLGPWDLSPELQPDGQRSSEKAIEMIETAMREGSHFFEWTHERLNGEEFPATVLLTRTKIAGKELLQATTRDITRQQQAEEALRQTQKMEAVGVLAAGIAHDFNNILQTVIGRVQLLLTFGGLDTQTAKNLEEVASTALRGASLVKRLLIFSRHIGVRKHALNLGMTIGDVSHILERTMSKLVTVDTRVQNGLWPVHADSYHIEQALLNMGMNAIEAMPDGGSLIIAAENRVADGSDADLAAGRYVVLTLSDTGTGIDEEDLEHIFEPFFSAKQRADHSGLGLAVVHGIVQAHDGFIRVASEPGVGTAFEVWLPVSEAAIPDEEVPKEIPVTTERLTVLVVDDEPGVGRLLCDILEEHGHRTLRAMDGKEGLEAFREHHEEIDLVMLDLVMPKLNGEQCLDEMLDINPEAAVMIVSGYALEDATREGLEPKIRGFLAKPFEIPAVLEAVNKAMSP